MMPVKLLGTPEQCKRLFQAARTIVKVAEYFACTMGQMLHCCQRFMAGYNYCVWSLERKQRIA
eukprot:scaffold991_cov128-Cylindrotheca_fusiformis.AAC.1